MQYVSLRITPANQSDLSVLYQDFLKKIFVILVGDKDYINVEKKVKLQNMNIDFITKPRKNMKKHPFIKRLQKIFQNDTK